MAKAVLMQGNEAAVEGAIAAGMRFFAGYPITPSTEIAEQSALRLPQEGGTFMQMEDEISSIAAVLGAGKRENGYVEGNGWLVSWCFGHLAEFASADVYNAKYEKWNYADLPIVPDPWEYAVSRDKAQQFNLLKSLMSRSDVSEVINACDAGREGEAIFRTVYNLSGCKKPMKRL